MQSNFDTNFISINTKIDREHIKKLALVFEEDTLPELLMKIINISADDDSSPLASLKPVSKTHIPLGTFSSLLNIGYQLLNINYEISFPLSIVLSKKSIIKYQMIFRQLLQIHVISRHLNQCTSVELMPGIRSFDNLQTTLRPILILLASLKSKMIYFVNSLLSYIQFEVIDYHWNVFMYIFSRGDLPNFQLLETVMSSHSGFLDGCLKDLFLTNWKLFRILVKVLSNCMLFATLCIKISKEYSKDISLASETNEHDNTNGKLDVWHT